MEFVVKYIHSKSMALTYYNFVMVLFMELFSLLAHTTTCTVRNFVAKCNGGSSKFPK